MVHGVGGQLGRAVAFRLFVGLGPCISCLDFVL